jgi:single-strand DNA-binding protein
MMINNVVLMGRLCADPELKTTQSGLSVTSFTIAVDREFVKQGDDKQTDFIDIVAWRQTAEFVTKYFTKGSMIAITGSIQTRNYEDKQGNKRKADEVVAREVSFCGSKIDSVPKNDSAPKQDDASDDEDDELPF